MPALYDPNFYRKREEAAEKLYQAALPPAKVIPPQRAASLVNRLSQVPRRLPNLQPPRPKDETMNTCTEGDRGGIPTYEAAKDEHLALYWARQQVLLLEKQQRKAPSTEGGVNEWQTAGGSSSSSAPTSARGGARPPFVFTAGEALLAPAFRRPKPPLVGTPRQYPYGRPATTPKTSRNRAEQRQRNDEAAANENNEEPQGAVRAHSTLRAVPPKSQKPSRAGTPTEKNTTADEGAAAAETSAERTGSRRSSRSSSGGSDSRSNSIHSAKRANSTVGADADADAAASEAYSSFPPSPEKRADKDDTSNKGDATGKSRTSSRSSSRSSSNNSRSSSHHSANNSAGNHSVTMAHEAESPHAGPKEEEGVGATSTMTGQLPATDMSLSLQSHDLKPYDPRSLSPGAHLPEATPTLTPAPDISMNYGDDGFEEEDEEEL